MSDIQANKPKMARSFYLFLISNHALDKFFKNFEKLDYQKYLFETPEELYLSNAFFWVDTDEGFNYWQELSEKWLELLNNLK